MMTEEQFISEYMRGFVVSRLGWWGWRAGMPAPDLFQLSCVLLSAGC